MKRAALAVALAFAASFALAACGGAADPSPEDQALPVAVSTPAPEPVAATATPPPPTPAQAPLPNPVQPRQGLTVWAVYFAVARPGAPELERAVQRVLELGVATGPGHLGCDEGAPEALGLPPEHEAVALYFANEADARAFAAAMDPKPTGVVKVLIACPD